MKFLQSAKMSQSTGPNGAILNKKYMRLKDKVAVITGGSRGIGFATVEKILSEGATVILTASTQASADKAVAKIKEKQDAPVSGISPNLASLESVKEALDAVVAKYGA